MADGAGQVAQLVLGHAEIREIADAAFGVDDDAVFGSRFPQPGPARSEHRRGGAWVSRPVVAQEVQEGVDQLVDLCLITVALDSFAEVFYAMEIRRVHVLEQVDAFDLFGVEIENLARRLPSGAFASASPDVARACARSMRRRAIASCG